MNILRANRKLLIKFSIITVAMFGFGFALVPFYEQICKVAGINNLLKPDTSKLDASAQNTQIDKTRQIVVEFDANVHNFPWQFKPQVNSMKVRPGELTQVIYEVVNQQDRPVTAQAIPSYGPIYAGQYFKKLECFCFSQQTLGPNEKKKFPVVFVIDPAMPKEIKTITLSYTFFEIPGAHIKQQPGNVSQKGINQ